jgi:hypothetical protein
MNVSIFATKDYENETTFRPQKNKPNSNPISVKKCLKCPVFLLIKDLRKYVLKGI